MTGRGIDQVLRFPSEPDLHERYVQSALTYVELAEKRNGLIPRPVEPAYIWGDAIHELGRRKPDARIINLETAITTSDRWEEKGINYRMNPQNAGCLNVAGIDCCMLANNHVLDWGPEGLVETLETLHREGIQAVGAGPNIAEASRPVAISRGGKGRVLIFGFGSPSSGIPAEWAATADAAGVNWIDERDYVSAVRVFKQMLGVVRGPNDLVVVSIHWGENWGYGIPEQQLECAHALVDAGADVIHGHSSHHVKGIEIYHGKLILYGCGDLITDYEGISGYEAYRGDLGLLYFVTASSGNGKLLSLEMVPVRLKRFRLESASYDDIRWLEKILTREGRGLGTVAEMQDGKLELKARVD